MESEELIDDIKNSLKQGVTEEDIFSTLLSQGMEVDEINFLLSLAKTELDNEVAPLIEQPSLSEDYLDLLKDNNIKYLTWLMLAGLSLEIVINLGLFIYIQSLYILIISISFILIRVLFLYLFLKTKSKVSVGFIYLNSIYQFFALLNPITFLSAVSQILSGVFLYKWQKKNSVLKEKLDIISDTDFSKTKIKIKIVGLIYLLLIPVSALLAFMPVITHDFGDTIFELILGWVAGLGPVTLILVSMACLYVGFRNKDSEIDYKITKKLIQVPIVHLVLFFLLGILGGIFEL